MVQAYQAALPVAQSPHQACKAQGREGTPKGWGQDRNSKGKGGAEGKGMVRQAAVKASCAQRLGPSQTLQ